MGIAPPVHVLKQWALWQDPSNGPFGFFRRGPDSDMALDSHGFVWHLLTFYISNLTSEASLWHSMLCPFTASVARGPSYIFLHLLTENHLPTGTFMNFDELSSFCQPRLQTTLRYSAKSVWLGGYDLIQTGPVRWLHHDAGTQRNWTRRATQCQCHCFLWSLGFFRRGPDSDMALDSHGFVWHLLTFYIGSFPLTFHALSLHGERGSRPTSYIFLLRIIFQLGLSWTLMNLNHFVNLVWKVLVGISSFTIHQFHHLFEWIRSDTLTSNDI